MGEVKTAFKRAPMLLPWELGGSFSSGITPSFSGESATATAAAIATRMPTAPKVTNAAVHPAVPSNQRKGTAEMNWPIWPMDEVTWVNIGVRCSGNQ